MKISQIKEQLKDLEELKFQLPDQSFVPDHFHVTEVGVVNKHFIDCGGTVRNERVANFQLWSASDHDHRLAPQKLIGIIELSEKVLGMEDLEIEVEYQSDTIGKYALGFNGRNFTLLQKQTDCLANDSCGMPSQKPSIRLSEISQKEAAACAPSSGCCS